MKRDLVVATSQEISRMECYLFLSKLLCGKQQNNLRDYYGTKSSQITNVMYKVLLTRKVNGKKYCNKRYSETSRRQKQRNKDESEVIKQMTLVYIQKRLTDKLIDKKLSL